MQDLKDIHAHAFKYIQREWVQDASYHSRVKLHQYSCQKLHDFHIWKHSNFISSLGIDICTYLSRLQLQDNQLYSVQSMIYT